MANEFKTLIIQQIKEVFDNARVYDEPVKQGLKTPAFLVLIFNNHQERQMRGSVAKTWSVSISYFPELEEVRSECDDIMERFQEEFHYIANRYHVHELSGEIVDDVLVITFDVKGLFKEKVEETKMQIMGGVRIG